MDYSQIMKLFWANDVMSFILIICIWLWVFAWIWSILWVTKDISLRSDSIFLQILSIIFVTVFTPLIWIPLHILIRPVQYRYDKNWRRDAIITNTIECPACGKRNLTSVNFCTNCWENLKTECKECKQKYSYEWDYCWNCWAPNLEWEI